MTALMRMLAVTLLIVGISVTGTGQALAHTVVTASDPPANTTLSAGPGRVSATFNEEPQTNFAAMTVVGPDGNLWSSGDPEVRGEVVGVAMRPLGPSGTYTVNYRVTSDDGHVVSGSWAFTVTVPSTGSPGPAVAGTAESHRIPLWPFIVGVVVLVAGVAAWSVLRRS
ncbi:MAG: copper resistance CopC family protein [Mycobacteriaceae bacterium]